MGFAKLNPFKRDRQNFPGIVIPLAEAPDHQPTDSSDEKAGLPKNNKSEDSAERGSAHESSSGSQHDTTHLTLEGLRAEIDADVAAGGVQDSMYDRMCPAPLSYLSISLQSTFTLPTSRE